MLLICTRSLCFRTSIHNRLLAAIPVITVSDVQGDDWKKTLIVDQSQFRPSGRSNRSGRSQADHDVFEGLPIRQWRQSETTVGLAPVLESVKGGDNAWPEPKLPRDTSLLLPHTQALLREARRPRLAKRKQEPTEDEKGEEEDEVDKDVQTAWQAKKWSQIPAHLEEPDREYLAKRRKGLPSIHTAMALQAAAAAVSAAPTRKTKVMKSDAEGNTTVYEVLVPEGQAIAGEVVEDTIMADAAPEKAAPGTIIEGVGIANAEGLIVATDLLQPPKRKNMPPKRIKKGGPGRGKKKVMFTGAEGQSSTATPMGPGGAVTSLAVGPNASGSAMDIDSTSRVAGDGIDLQTGEGDGDEDDAEDGEEGEEGDGDGDEDDDREDGELSDVEAPAVSTGPATPTTSAAPIASEVLETLPPVEVASLLPPTLLQDSVEADAPVVASSPEKPTQVQPQQDTDQTTATFSTSETSAPTPITAMTSNDDSAPPRERNLSSPPELPLAQTSDERQEPLVELVEDVPVASPSQVPTVFVAADQDGPSKSAAQTPHVLETSTNDDDLLSKFEKELEQQEGNGP